MRVPLKDDAGKIYWQEVKVEESSKEVSTWVDRAMYSSEPTEAEGLPKVTLLSATPDPLGALGAMCAMYEGRVIRDPSDLDDDDRRRYWDQVSKTHLKAPLEAIDLHFMIENVTRAFTHQMVRQRTAVYAQESLRFAVKEQIAARPGPLTSANRTAMTLWKAAMESAWNHYNALIGAGIPAEEARGVLPHDTLTRLNYKTNLRNLVDHLGNRLCTQAQFEWRLVGAQIVKAISEYGHMYDIQTVGSENEVEQFEDSAWQFRYIASSDLFRPVCFAMGRCPFQADFDRGCTIRERMDSGRADEVRTEEWLCDPQAGWVR
jgi:flavin-dependent thymidylate synthase